MSTARLDYLREIERAVQQKWAALKTFEVDAPLPGAASTPEKFFVTFPVPYMNGKLHLGHAFSLTKSEFSVRYMRMCGRRSLWPFGLHVTGTPIAACAQKLQNEINMYGNPPQFPEELMSPVTPQKAETVPGQHKSKRGKVAQAKPQWLIMRSLGISDEEIPKFADAQYWLKFFPQLAIDDLKHFGVHVDWRRSFITTEANPFFDRFVTWQFHKLSAGNYLKFGKRYTIFSPSNNQPCADHDRASGEGVLPVEYTLIKLTVQNPLSLEVFAEQKDLIGDRPVILPGATLRAETICGTTNCWVSPDITYKAYIVKADEENAKEEIHIMTQRAARNLSYQGFLINDLINNVECTPLFEISGARLVGVPLSAPFSKYETVYTLPMFTISDVKGTAVVLSVPSDSPDDYVNFMQLKKKADYRAKLGLKDEWILPFDIVPIINVPGEAGDDSAAYWVKKLGINGPKDSVKLEDAKKNVYQTGFYTGKMITGPYSGMKVAEAKVKTMQELKRTGEGMPYYEPMRQVISRSGDECVVALTEQWYIEYGKKEWREAVMEHLDNHMETYASGTRHNLEETLNWLADWPCSRTFGLGTKLPTDETGTMVIDSLSDSTIYMSYYTIAHFFHVAADGSYCVDARAPNKYGIRPEMMTDKSWDYIFHGTGSAEELEKETGLPAETAKLMRNEFAYWYPVDLRVSAKDLIQNHLTMFLYNHAAIWPENPELWPRSIYCNGHIQVDNEKMSKSLGNFITLKDAVDMYGADCCRLACADAGDSLDDANFVRETATNFILRMTTLIDQIKELVSKRATYRTGEDLTIFDKICIDSMNGCIQTAKEGYDNMCFRVSLNAGYYDLLTVFSTYRLACEAYNNAMHLKAVDMYCNTITLLLQPLVPHVSEFIWSTVLGNKTLATDAPFPKAETRDYSLQVTSRVITDVLKLIRAQVAAQARKKGAPEIKSVCIYTASSYLPWQIKALEMMHKLADSCGGFLPPDMAKRIMSNRPEWMTKEIIQEAMAFMAFVKMNTEKFGTQAMNIQPSIDDYVVLKNLEHYISNNVGVSDVKVYTRDDESAEGDTEIRHRARPGEPTIAFI